MGKLDGGPRGVDGTKALSWLTLDSIGEFPSTGSQVSLEYFKATECILIVLDLLRLVLPSDMLAQLARHQRSALEKMCERIALGDTGCADFFGHILSSNLTDKGKHNEALLASKSMVPTTAGSETTATTLAAITQYLLRNCHYLSHLTKEVQDAFDDASYLLAIIEGLTSTRPCPKACRARPRTSLSPPAPPCSRDTSPWQALGLVGEAQVDGGVS
ncbi:uncharacterized protein BCR38DRAFT_406804 [Pseudomassariella vexata]|uniref:Uncharacterized protein n=1 Tax=Pseudomassariella vexata TaxID=1141098 RepID=A0A1Y2ECD6_9PEZI|nr:uncharacterized protein BCR38DRAFT_406804 [Pseudomassariella vexata]ORY68926.1 hypothetical protein BCR38DRAFT_406804 [Pseudomassariella vexata]